MSFWGATVITNLLSLLFLLFIFVLKTLPLSQNWISTFCSTISSHVYNCSLLGTQLLANALLTPLHIVPEWYFFIKSHLQSYPCPLQINFFWNMGFLLAVAIILQCSKLFPIKMQDSQFFSSCLQLGDIFFSLFSFCLAWMFIVYFCYFLYVFIIY